jgi:hypothetical protein
MNLETVNPLVLGVAIGVGVGIGQKSIGVVIDFTRNYARYLVTRYQLSQAGFSSSLLDEHMQRITDPLSYWACTPACAVCKKLGLSVQEP